VWQNLKGAARIARKLTENAIAVLRFDFTGLGNSEGDFPALLQIVGGDKLIIPFC
jgi:hypothetical protein